MPDRIDHFQRMRGEKAPTEKPPEDAPAFSQLQADYLKATFPRSTPEMAGSVDQAVAHAVWEASEFGQQQVINHIQALVPQEG